MNKIDFFLIKIKRIKTTKNEFYDKQRKKIFKKKKTRKK